jgi:hypothetical protein
VKQNQLCTEKSTNESINDVTNTEEKNASNGRSVASARLRTDMLPLSNAMTSNKAKQNQL